MIRWLLNMFHGDPPPPPPTAAQHEADEELQRAQEKLRESQQQAREGKAVARRLERINEENHFAEKALAVLRGIVQ